MMLSWPCSASTGVRASGASTNRTPCFASASRICVVVAGSLVDVSTTISPCARRARDAVGAEHDLLDLRRAGHAQEHDVGCARDLGVGLRLLRARREQVVDGRAVAMRAHASADSPWSTRFFAMPWPIRPTPMKPMRGLSMLVLLLGSSDAGVEVRPADVDASRSAVGSGGSTRKRARRRSCSAMSKPAAGDDAPCRRASTRRGSRRKTTQPISVAQTSCMYVNGVSADAGARWNARMNRKCPSVPSRPPATISATSVHGMSTRPVEAGQQRRHDQRADERRVEQHHARILAGQQARQDLVASRRSTRRASASSDAPLEDLAARPHDQQHPDDAGDDERDPRPASSARRGTRRAIRMTSTGVE